LDVVLYIYFYLMFFFFSSRRRHTRCYRDWSSDVCLPIFESEVLVQREIPNNLVAERQLVLLKHFAFDLLQPNTIQMRSCPGEIRSEERRVGKECRMRWAA